MSRGILSVYWGDKAKLPIDRLKASVKKLHPELSHEIISIDAPSEQSQYFKSKSDNV